MPVPQLVKYNRSILPALAASAALLGTVASTNGQPCIPHWDNAIGQPGFSGSSSYVAWMLTFDDGTGRGEELYVGGHFTHAGGVPASNIARWNGQEWSPVGAGIGGEFVDSLAVFDDGSGSGPMLYAGGYFSTAGGVEARNIARWNGSQWEQVGGGINGFVIALRVIDVGNSGHPVLFAGGAFTEAGGMSIRSLAAWDGIAWAPVGGDASNTVYSLGAFDDGQGGGASLIAGGDFRTIGNVSANRIAKWDGQAWAPLGSGSRFTVRALGVLDDGRGAGPTLYANGTFTDVNGQEIRDLGKWDGENWSGLGDGVNASVNTIVSFDDGSGPALFVGGLFGSAGGVITQAIAKWDGFEWSAVGQSGVSGPSPWVYELYVEQAPGESGTLYVGGSFGSVDRGSLPARNIIEWRGCARPRLALTPSCPSGGRITIGWSDATPSAQIALVFARTTGNFVIPTGQPCAGTRLGLSSQQIQLAYTGASGANGARTINATAGPNACGGYLQLLDVASCRTSEAVRIE